MAVPLGQRPGFMRWVYIYMLLYGIAMLWKGIAGGGTWFLVAGAGGILAGVAVLFVRRQ